MRRSNSLSSATERSAAATRRRRCVQRRRRFRRACGALARRAPADGSRARRSPTSTTARANPRGKTNASCLCIGATFGVPVRVRGARGAGRDEASLREARYAALGGHRARDGRRRRSRPPIMREDQSETVLLALFRGAGPEGSPACARRRPLADGLELVRPLLRTKVRELRYYCHVHALPYAVDPTNADRRTCGAMPCAQALDALRPLFPGLDAAVARAALRSLGEPGRATGRAPAPPGSRRAGRARGPARRGFRARRGRRPGLASAADRAGSI